MTRQFDGFGNPTEFSLWLRHQPDIDSTLGFVTTDIDFMWHNYKTGEWMLIEEKRHRGRVRYAQRGMLEIIHKACFGDVNYRGLHLLVFENTAPQDGRIWLNHIEITSSQLIQFLQFNLTMADIAA